MRLVLFVLWLCTMMQGLQAFGQTFPSKPIRVVASGVGGGGDFGSRLIAQGLAARLGQQVIVENRGGSAIIPAQIVAQAPPDGYTLLSYASTIWLLPLLQNVPYDPMKDFSPITLAVSSPNVLVVHPSLSVKSVRELIALAKARPGALSYASTAAGGPPHLAAELFKSMAGLDIVRVPYKGATLGLTELMAGQVQLYFLIPTAVMPHVRSGRLRALAVTSAKPSPLVPGLPTLAATLPGYEMVTNLGIFAPARTPDAIIKKLNQEIVQVLNQPDVKEKFFNAGTDTVGTSPETFASAMSVEMAAIAKLIKTAGIRSDDVK